MVNRSKLVQKTNYQNKKDNICSLSILFQLIISIIAKANMEIHQLTKLIKSKTGMRIQDFALQKMGIRYSLYRYRVLNDCLKVQDYHAIMFYTGKSFEELFPNPLNGNRKPIPLNLHRRPATTTPFAEPQVSQAKSPATTKKDAIVPPKREDIKKEGELNPPRSFEFADPFEGMLPD